MSQTATQHSPAAETDPGELSPTRLLASMRWRYATKAFDATRAIPGPVWRALEEALTLAPSSYGLQPWKFFVVDDPTLRTRLKAAAWNQGQISDASRLVVLAARTDLGLADVQRHLQRVSEVRGVPLAALDGYRQMLLSAVDRPPEAVAQWAARQVYIALGTLLTAAATLGVDACPMEGFDREQFDAILDLPAQGYTAIVVAALGYRAQDATAQMAKVRFAHADVIAHL